MRTISNTIISITALVMFFTFALGSWSMAASRGHMHAGNGWTMMHNGGEGYGPQSGHMGNGYMGNGHMGGHMGGGMMNGGHMYGNTQAAVPCDYIAVPQAEVSTSPSQ